MYNLPKLIMALKCLTGELASITPTVSGPQKQLLSSSLQTPPTSDLSQLQRYQQLLIDKLSVKKIEGYG